MDDLDIENLSFVLDMTDIEHEEFYESLSEYEMEYYTWLIDSGLEAGEDFVLEQSRLKDAKQILSAFTLSGKISDVEEF